MADGTIREFLVELGYKVDPNSERKFNESLKGAVVQAQLLADAIEGMARIVVEGVQKVARSFDSLYWSSQRTGASVQNIRALSYAVSQLGGSYEGTRSAIEAFGQHLRSNPGYVNLVKSLGVSTEANGQLRDQVDVLRDVGAALSKKSYPIALQYAGALGLDENTLRALMSGDLGRRMDEYVKIQQAAGLDSEEAAKRSKDFMQALTQLQSTIEAVVTKVLTDLEPTLTEKLNALSQWFIDHKEDIKSFIIAVSQAIEGLIEDLGKLIEAFKPVFKTFDDMAKALTGKDGLQAAFETFAVFLAGSWLLRVLGVFSKFKGGFLSAVGLLLADGVVTGSGLPGAAEIASAEKGAWYNRAWQGVKTWWNGGKAGNTAVGSEAGKPLSNSQRDQNAEESYKILRDAGLSREAALGVVANEDAESGFNPRATGDGGQASGGFQWHPDRQAAILRGTGIDVTDPNTPHGDHVRAALWEMQHSNDAGARKAWALLQDAKTPAEAAAIFTQYFERPADTSGQSYARGVKANTWATRLKDPSDNPPTKEASSEIPKNENPLTKENFPGIARDRPTKDDDLRALIKNGADNAQMTTPPLTTGGTTTNSNVTLQQTTNISVMGSGDPTATANSVERRQNSVNSLMLRNTQGAVR